MCWDDCIQFSATMLGLSASPVTRSICQDKSTDFCYKLLALPPESKKTECEHSIRDLSLSGGLEIEETRKLTCSVLRAWAHWNWKERKGNQEERYSLIKHSPWDCNVVSDLAT